VLLETVYAAISLDWIWITFVVGFGAVLHCSSPSSRPKCPSRLLSIATSNHMGYAMPFLVTLLYLNCLVQLWSAYPPLPFVFTLSIQVFALMRAVSR
jgi:hypothetical protein